MALNGTKAYALSRKYTEETADEFGAVKGAPCQIESIVDNFDDSHTVNFKWENTEGEVRRGEMKVNDGEDGTWIVNAKVSTEDDETKGHLIIKLNDGTVIDAGNVASTMPIATQTTPGAVMPGNGMTIDANGRINATGIDVQIDDHLDPISGNPVANRVITEELDKKMSAEVIGNTLTFI